MWGDRDKLVDPALAPRLAAAVPDARLQLLEGVGHVAMLEAPEPTARAVLGMVEDCAARAAGAAAGVTRSERRRAACRATPRSVRRLDAG